MQEIARTIFEKFKTDKRILFIAIIVLVLLIIMIAIIIKNNIDSSKINFFDMVDIVNYDNFSEQLPKDKKEDLESLMSGILKTHFEADNKKNSIQATIRQDTIENNGNDIEFIVDVDDYQQSYDVIIYKSDEGENIPQPISIECTNRELSKYPDVVCYGMEGRTDLTSTYLPYEDVLSSGESFVANYSGKDNYGNEHIAVTVHDCNEEYNKEEAVEKTKKYLESVGRLEADNFIYQRTSDYSNCN